MIGEDSGNELAYEVERAEGSMPSAPISAYHFALVMN